MDRKLSAKDYPYIQMGWNEGQWAKYEARVEALEREGCTRSDAQGVTDCEVIQGKLVI
jgi:hypothetical protein